MEFKNVVVDLTALERFDIGDLRSLLLLIVRDEMMDLGGYYIFETETE